MEIHWSTINKPVHDAMIIYNVSACENIFLKKKDPRNLLSQKKAPSKYPKTKTFKITHYTVCMHVLES